MRTDLEQQLLDALVYLLAASMGVGSKHQAQKTALAAVIAAGGEPVQDEVTQPQIDELTGDADRTLTLHKADGDTAKIIRGKQLVALIIRSASGRWMLCDAKRAPLLKVEFSTPKKAFTHYEENH